MAAGWISPAAFVMHDFGKGNKFFSLGKILPEEYVIWVRFRL